MLLPLLYYPLKQPILLFRHHELAMIVIFFQLSKKLSESPFKQIKIQLKAKINNPVSNPTKIESLEMAIADGFPFKCLPRNGTIFFGAGGSYTF